MPSPYKMDRRITIEQNTPTTGASGEQVPSWSTLATVWAQVLPVKAMERWTSQQMQVQIDAKFRIRYRSDVTAQHRIVFEGRTYDIQGVSEVPRRRALEIVGHARVE